MHHAELMRSWVANRVCACVVTVHTTGALSRVQRDAEGRSVSSSGGTTPPAALPTHPKERSLPSLMTSCACSTSF
eukprot:2286669-Pyramimonas_sp.AAC.1